MSKKIAIISLKDFESRESGVFHYSTTYDGQALCQKPVHRRDDHFLFIFQYLGESSIEVDFTEIELKQNMFFCIQPGQVHLTRSVNAGTSAWIMVLNSSKLTSRQKGVIEAEYFNYMPVLLNPEVGNVIQQCFELIEAGRNVQFSQEMEHALTEVCIVAITNIYETQQQQSKIDRKRTITKQFKSILLDKFRRFKSVEDYARALHISSKYLSEAVMQISGLTVSHWIQQAVIAEAKRFLYATDKTVKEISLELGFKDAAYFNRYFSRIEKIPPMKYRHKYRK